MDTEALGPHRTTYEAIFRHPVARDLQWRNVRAMLVSLADATEGRDGVVRFARNGQTLVVRPPPRKDFSDVQALMQIRQFLESSDVAPAAGAVNEGVHLLVVVDEHEARIFRTELHGSVPQRVTPYDAHLTHRHVRGVDDAVGGRGASEFRAYYEALVGVLAGAQSIVIFGGSGGGSGSAMDRLVEELKARHPGLARRVLGTRVVDEGHMSVEHLLEEARRFYAGRGPQEATSQDKGSDAC